MTLPGGTYLLLLAGQDERGACGMIAWSKRTRRLVIIDVEHDEATLLGSWAEFIADPAGQIAKQWS